MSSCGRGHGANNDPNGPFRDHPPRFGATLKARSAAADTEMTDVLFGLIGRIAGSFFRVFSGAGAGPINQNVGWRRNVVNGESTVFSWLRGGVPLSLLLDLACPEGPDSAAIARHERGGVSRRG